MQQNVGISLSFTTDTEMNDKKLIKKIRQCLAAKFKDIFVEIDIERNSYMIEDMECTECGKTVLKTEVSFCNCADVLNPSLAEYLEESGYEISYKDTISLLCTKVHDRLYCKSCTTKGYRHECYAALSNIGFI